MQAAALCASCKPKPKIAGAKRASLRRNALLSLKNVLYYKNTGAGCACTRSFQKNLGACSAMLVLIREEQEKEYDETEQMTRRAFWNKYRPGCYEHYLVHLLRTDAACVPQLTRVAEADGKVVGLILYTKSLLKTAEQEIPVLTFGPLCVDPAYQKKGIGAKLLHTTLDAAKALGYPGVIIFGSPDYYRQHGFFPCSRWGITTAEGESFDAFMGCELIPGGLHFPGAKFYEAPVFSSLSMDAVEEYDKKFPYMEKLRLPGQLEA